MVFLAIPVSSFFHRPLTNPVLVFAFLLLVILVSPIILRRLNIPGIIGLIVAGIIIGPHGFNLIEKSDAVELFATIGLLYIMFIAGLDLDIVEFARNKNKSILFGFYTFIIPLVIGFPVCYFLLKLNFLASLLISSMFSTHTLVSYPIVSKMGVNKNSAVATAVGGTIITDTAVLLLLAFIIGSWQGNLDKTFFIRLLLGLTIQILFVFLVIPKLSHWFFKKLESEKYSHYIFVLSMVFMSAFCSELAGIEPIIGAFLAGLTFSRIIPHTSALMNRIEFIGNSLFIPFFLLGVGMFVNMAVIFQGKTAIFVALSLTLVALLGKWVAAWITQISLKFSLNQRNLIFGLSSSHAAATLAVIFVGYKAGILDENIINGTIILILFTCIISSFVTDRASRRILLSNELVGSKGLKSHTNKSEHILLPIANLTNMEKLLDFAILIKDKKSANPITLLSVVPNNKVAEENIKSARSHLEAFVKHASATETMVNITATIDYNIAGGINRTSRELMADTIILGWPRKENFVNKLFGERMERLLRNTDRMLIVCHFSKTFYSHRKICVFCPEYTELEKGFSNWLSKLMILAGELKIGITFYCFKRTMDVIIDQYFIKRIDNNFNFEILKQTDDHKFEDFPVTPDDLAVFIIARRGSVSYKRYFDNLPERVEKSCSDNNFILIYPTQFNQIEPLNVYADVPQQGFF